MITISVWWIPGVYAMLRVAYWLGRRSGHKEAMSHCEASFLAKLHVMKAMMDNVLRNGGFGVATPDELKLTLNHEVIFEGSPLEAAERSQAVTSLIKHIEMMYPDLVVE